MTIKAVEWALKREGISSTAKLVLVMLCDCINAKDEFAFPSQRRIAEVVGRGERQVRRHIDALKRAGLVHVARGAGAGRGRGRSSDRYYLACNHLTGEDRSLDAETIAQCGTLTGGHSSPLESNTGGHNEHPVNDTGGHSRQLQADVSGAAYIEEPEKEPELPLPERVEPTNSMASSDKPKKARLDGKRAIELYNEAAARSGWCVAKGAPSHARKQAIGSRLREHGMEGWVEQLAIAAEMPFLRGENDTGWRMGIDYFARPSGWSKIAEGGFKRTRPRDAEQVTHEEAEHQAARKYFETRGRWPQGYIPPAEARA